MDRRISIAEAKQIDLVDYLALLGHYHDPKKSRNGEYWYLSPLPGRDEKVPSFKVDRRRRLWYDHGIGEGGNLIDFGIRYHRCSVKELLERLQTFSFSFQPLPSSKHEPDKGAGERKIRVVSTRPITSPALVRYLGERRIPVELAQKFCQQVGYELYGRQYYALGFKNNSGGYELRNAYFKASSSPKDTTFIDQGAADVAVFEGFFDFLSYMVLQSYEQQPPVNFLILNSLSFFEKSRPVMEKHAGIFLYLDHNPAGRKVTLLAVKDNKMYQDRSDFYRDCEDVNQWLVQNFSRLQHALHAQKKAKQLYEEMKKADLNIRTGGKGKHL